MRNGNQPATKPNGNPTITPTKPATPTQDPSKVKIPKPAVKPAPKA
jgi:hypothetical protein